MEKAFRISITIFGVFVWLLIVAIIANTGGFDYILESTSPITNSLKPLVKVIQVTQGLDVLITFLSGISSLITYFLKS
jgi:hypothetical protein